MIRTAILLAALLASGTARAEIRVLDGDTIVVEHEHIRLVGFNAPETAHASCEAERRLGALAKARLTDLLLAACGPLDRAGASCMDLAREPRKDRYGRSLARLSLGGMDVAAILIGDRLAEPYVCPAGRCPRRLDWCRGKPGEAPP
ncbi:endonuclease YncB(thermonuclease family) [Angulomicrobium tetraedrale]|uniref:Endonuclease YncB(Thermonuclease family) n=1 Tax=Ancylobacter tetraedralis TaxID=217068 RepID=A0A839ZA12_9HYPH|nr:thermonuclease family protein [Ancylobacter tetraedralis]MBB3771573.1 endonuclease YncB(thermonuclease family) [Ancylobacter tetraedralis]